MGNRGVVRLADLPHGGDAVVAKVYDLAIGRQRLRRGAKIGRGTARRANPGLRPPIAVQVPDWEAVAALSKKEIRDVLTGKRQPPLRTKRTRRAGEILIKPRTPLTRAQRRLAWKVERRTSGVAWSESRSARGELAPVIPIGSRHTAARLRSPHGLVASATDPMGRAS